MADHSDSEQLTMLYGEVLATQMILVTFMDHLMKGGGVTRDFIKGIFDEADLLTEATTIRAGKMGIPNHTAQQFMVLKQLRNMIFPEEMPK